VPYSFQDSFPETAPSGYSLELEGARDLTRQLLDRQPLKMDDRYVCFEINGNDPLADIGRYVERARFEEVFNNTSNDMQQEYGPYEEASTFFVSVDRDDVAPTGVLRIIRNSPAGLKTLNDVAGPPLLLSEDQIMERHNIETLDNCWDIGTVAALSKYPSHGASIQLYRAMYLAAKRDNIEHFVSVIDMRVLTQLTGDLGIPFQPLADSEPFEYLGSDRSQAVYGYVSELYEEADHRRLGLKALFARKILGRLFGGTEDHTIVLNDYKK
jgi:hypothetical protein